jgi:hypothetical protein
VLFALSRSFLRKFHTWPRSVLLPLFSVMLTTPPPVRPYCASYVFVWILNSSTASTGGPKL